METTPKYKIPYLTDADKIDDWPPYYKQLAERVEQVISEQVTTPLKYATANLGELNVTTTGWVTPPTEGLARTDPFTIGSDNITVTQDGVYQVLGTLRFGNEATAGNMYARCYTVHTGVYGGFEATAKGVSGIITLNVSGILKAGAVAKLQVQAMSGKAKNLAGTFTMIRLGDAP
ncbi:hypothetical protein [Streptomyces sp. NPDC087300]|uniref:hypothetical protein n=1 Tax=Streptomyces sp. NPDC087300 TaxID=3365780 RepID=UPI003807E123